MENTKENTTSGAESLLVQTEVKNESPVGAATLVLPTKVLENVPAKGDGDKPKAKVNLGTMEERLSILQDAARNYQKAGGKIRMGQVKDILVIALEGVVVEDNLWLLANLPNDKPKAKEEVSSQNNEPKDELSHTPV